MSLENGILGFLSMNSLSGYDIKKLFNISAAYFWPADQAQIYRTLKKLEEGNLIEVSGFEHGTGPCKKVYSITGKGRETLHDWLLSSKQSDFITHQPFLMQLFFSGILSREEFMKFIEKQLEQDNELIRELRENYNKNKKAYAESMGLRMDDPRFVSAVQTHRWGIFICEAYSKMLEDIRTDIFADENK